MSTAIYFNRRSTQAEMCRREFLLCFVLLFRVVVSEMRCSTHHVEDQLLELSATMNDQTAIGADGQKHYRVLVLAFGRAYLCLMFQPSYKRINPCVVLRRGFDIFNGRCT